MVGREEPRQDEIFVACSLRELIPADHILRRVNKVLNLSWLRSEVKGLYDEYQGRPSIAPESAVRLMLAGFFEGIVQDRKLMRQAQVNLAIRWFAGYKLHEKLPRHSSLTRIRQRWGEERFRKIFQKTVEQCLEAGLVDGETVHVDATLIRADVSWESLVERHAEQVLAENREEEGPGSGGPGGANEPGSKRDASGKKVSRTDPEATMTTSCNSFPMEPSYKQHTAVDDRAGVVVDVSVSTGEKSEGEQLLDQVERIEANTGRKIETLTADAGYAHSENYRKLEARGTEAIIPPQAETRPKRIPLRRFKYDAKHRRVKCPGGKALMPRGRGDGGTWYRAKPRDCAACALRGRCFGPTARARQVLIKDGYEALLRARRRRNRWSERERAAYVRHRWRVEGVHGEAKTQHGLRRAVRRGRWNVAIQAYLAAAVINLKRLAALLRLILSCLWERPAVPKRLLSTLMECSRRNHQHNDSHRMAA